MMVQPPKLNTNDGKHFGKLCHRYKFIWDRQQVESHIGLSMITKFVCYLYYSQI